MVTFLFFVICGRAFGQNLTKIQREYFILGTLDDYMGRNADPRFAKMLDRYYANEGPLLTTIDSLLKIDYSESVYNVQRNIDTLGNPMSFSIYSDTLAKKYNSYYTFKPSGSFTVDADPELDSKPILLGALKPDIFKTDSVKLAFLAGTYVRFGFENDTAYMLNMGNSLSKAKICYQLLKEFNCRPYYEILKNNIPVMHHVYFHPSAQVAAYMQRYMYLRKQLAANLMAIFKKMISDDKKR